VTFHRNFPAEKVPSKVTIRIFLPVIYTRINYLSWPDPALVTPRSSPRARHPALVTPRSSTLHVDATTPACSIQQYNPNASTWITELFNGGAVRVKNGFAELPTRPGLGVELNEKVAAQHPYQPVNRPN